MSTGIFRGGCARATVGAASSRATPTSRQVLKPIVAPDAVDDLAAEETAIVAIGHDDEAAAPPRHRQGEAAEADVGAAVAEAVLAQEHSQADLPVGRLL